MLEPTREPSLKTNMKFSTKNHIENTNQPFHSFCNSITNHHHPRTGPHDPRNMRPGGPRQSPLAPNPHLHKPRISQNQNTNTACFEVHQDTTPKGTKYSPRSCSIRAPAMPPNAKPAAPAARYLPALLFFSSTTTGACCS